jgi:hypothetical protein
MSTGRFDARAYWEALSPKQQREIGELTLLLAVAGDLRTVCVTDRAYARWEHAGATAERRLVQILPALAVAFPEGPDLAALGIRACRVCGCSEVSACAGGCSWVAADLCSRCPPSEPLDEPR